MVTFKRIPRKQMKVLDLIKTCYKMLYFYNNFVEHCFYKKKIGFWVRLHLPIKERVWLKKALSLYKLEHFNNWIRIL